MRLMSVGFSVEPISAFSRTNARFWGAHDPLVTEVEALSLHLLSEAGRCGAPPSGSTWLGGRPSGTRGTRGKQSGPVEQLELTGVSMTQSQYR